MSASVRAAAPNDAAAIARIAEDALSVTVDASSRRVQRILREKLTFVAAERETVLGFVHNFITLDSAREKRLELDLLAVAPSAQGRGLGASLLERSLAAAETVGARRIRALVRRDNEPMRRLCARQGFTPAALGCQLFVTDPKPLSPPTSKHEARLISVETLSYSGIWLEGALSDAAIKAAQWQAWQARKSRIGAVVPGDDRQAIELLLRNNFLKVGDYDWWSITLRND